MIDITKLKNDKERIAFLEDYRNIDNGWRLWKGDMDLRRKWWRFDLETCSLIVEEREQTILWPKPHTDWIVSSWYVIHEWSGLFEDGKASRTMALAEIKKRAKK